MKFLIIFLLSVMLVTGAEATMSLPKSKLLVDFKHERLSVSARDIALKDLLSEIAAKTGIVIGINDSHTANQQSSAEFKNIPPVLAFQSILRNLNFALFYSGARLVRVLILPVEVQTSTANRKLMKPNPVGRELAQADNPSLQFGATPRLPVGNHQDSDVQAKLDTIAAMEDSDDAGNIDAVEKALTDGHHKVRTAALRVLAHKTGPDVTQVLRLGLNDFDPEFRIEALEILADRGDVDSLRKALADRNQEVRETAADLLWNLRTQQ